MTITRVILAIALLTVITITYVRSEAAVSPNKVLCDEVRYELAQQVREGLLEPSTADTINRRCDEYQKQEEASKRPRWWE